MVLYYITDRHSLGATEPQRCEALLQRIAEAARAGVDYIQIREKDLPARALEKLAREAVRRVREHSSCTRLLINGRTDIALASDADGVHLPSDDLPASESRTLWRKSCRREPLIGVSAHSEKDVRYAEAHAADFAVLAPIFEKVAAGADKVATVATGIGLDALRAATRSCDSPGNTEALRPSTFPVLALGGVTLSNARQCVAAGAIGVAGIRLFQTGDVAETVRRLRAI